MNTIKALVLSFFTLLLLSSCGGADQKSSAPEQSKETKKMDMQSYVVDVDLSKVYWKGSMLGMYSHEGTLEFIKGKFSLKQGSMIDGSFVVNMNTIIPTDDGYNEEEGKTKDKLVGHLSSDDFFAVDKFPNSSLVMKGGKLMLTIRDKSHVVKLKEIFFSPSGEGVMGTAELVFDRKQFDVAFDHPAQDMVLSDEIAVRVEIIGDPV